LVFAVLIWPHLALKFFLKKFSYLPPFPLKLFARLSLLRKLFYFSAMPEFGNRLGIMSEAFYALVEDEVVRF
jgi:hypothetical protein